MPVPSFPEAVRNERKMFEPLLSDRPTNRIRRHLFQGKVVGTDQYTHEHYGASSGLIHQTVAEMQRWGYQFERVRGEDGKNGFKLLNPSHEPTDRIKKPAGPPRNRRVVEDAPQGARGDLRRAIRAALEAGDAMTARECSERFHCTEGNLRAVVQNMERDGFTFDTFPSKTGKVYAMKKGGRSLAKTNGHHDPMPILAFGSGKQIPHEVVNIPPMPSFGTHIQFVGQFLNPDNSVSLAFRNDDGDQWVTTLEGHTPVDT